MWRFNRTWVERVKETLKDSKMNKWRNGRMEGWIDCLRTQWKDGEKRWMERVDVRNGEMSECLCKAVYPDY